MIYIIIGIFLVLISIIIIYNNLIRLKNEINEASANIDVYEKKRWDLVPNLINTVKGYTKHEEETLEKIVNLRNNISSEKIKNENKIETELKNVFALAESYPELKANENFLELSSQLKKIEEDISYSRNIYNKCATKLNSKIETFPINILSKLFGIKKVQLFTIPEEQKQNVKVQF